MSTRRGRLSNRQAKKKRDSMLHLRAKRAMAANEQELSDFLRDCTTDSFSKMDIKLGGSGHDTGALERAAGVKAQAKKGMHVCNDLSTM